MNHYEYLSGERYGIAVRNMLSGCKRIDIAVSYWGRGILEALSLDRLLNLSDRPRIRVICDLFAAACHYEPIEKMFDAEVELKRLGALHSKIWVSESCGILGSANASKSALRLFKNTDNGNFELGIRLEKCAVRDLQTLFNNLWDHEECLSVTRCDVDKKKAQFEEASYRIHTSGGVEFEGLVEPSGQTRFPSATEILKSAEIWRERCLERGQSVFTDKQLWTKGNLEELARRIERAPRKSEFEVQIRLALEGASEVVCQLLAEMYWLYILIHKVFRRSKRKSIRFIWEMSGESAPMHQELLDSVLAKGVVAPGQSLSQKFSAMRFLTLAMVDLLRLTRRKRIELLSSGWEFARMADNIYLNKQRSQARHVLLFLMFPDQFEPIISTEHKIKIAACEKYSNLIGKPRLQNRNDLIEVDKRLLKIRDAARTEELGRNQLL